nr:hypothetical protein Q903MT_gene3437 [Picea sitchensis]
MNRAHCDLLRSIPSLPFAKTRIGILRETLLNWSLDLPGSALEHSGLNGLSTTSTLYGYGWDS